MVCAVSLNTVFIPKRNCHCRLKSAYNDVMNGVRVAVECSYKQLKQ